MRPPAFLVVGRIGRAHGVHGEVAVDVLTDFPDRFAPGARLFVGPDDSAPEPATVLGARPHRDRLLVTFDLAADRTSAAALAGLWVFVPTAEAHALEPDTYYPHQLIGLAVATREGRDLGTVVDLIETGAADVLVVRGGAGTVLLPLTGEVIAAIDLAAGQVTVTPLPGLLPDEGA